MHLGLLYIGRNQLDLFVVGLHCFNGCVYWNITQRWGKSINLVTESVYHIFLYKYMFVCHRVHINQVSCQSL